MSVQSNLPTHSGRSRLHEFTVGDELTQLANINVYADLLIAALGARKALIDNMRLVNSPLLEKAEQIQHDELKKISTINHEWTMQRPRKTQHKLGKATVNGIHETATFDEVGPSLSYVVPHDHYAIRICGLLIHGNVGQILEARLPEKIKNCRIRNCKITGCPFYHDPVIYGGCERRNFIKTQELILNGENVDRFTDRIMHDLLTLIMYHFG